MAPSLADRYKGEVLEMSYYTRKLIDGPFNGEL
jgi:hypothetical protein